jgi:hypothetical protein
VHAAVSFEGKEYREFLEDFAIQTFDTFVVQYLHFEDRREILLALQRATSYKERSRTSRITIIIDSVGYLAFSERVIRDSL